LTINRRHALLLLSFFLIAYILPLGARDLLVPDETRYGEIPREMIASGDWVVPHLNGLRYFEKPPLGYWVHAGSLLVFGENNFAVRLPSALAAGLSALLLFALVGRLSRDKDSENGWPDVSTALIYLSCFGVFGIGNIAVLDSLFTCFLTATITAFFLASEARPGSAEEKRFLLLAGLSCGAAFLTKGFLAVAVPVLTLAPYLVWQRRYIDLFRMSWLPILTAVLVAMPWGILIHLREPDFWRYFIRVEHIQRFMADSAQHKASFWYFFLAAPGMAMPWTFAVPAAVPGIRDRLNEQGPRGRLMKLAACWLLLPFLFFSVSKGKLLTYILPCFPPFAVLMAFGLSRALARGKSRAFHFGLVAAVVFFGLILLALIGVQIFDLGGLRPFSRPWKVTMLANGIVFMAIFCFWSLRSPIARDKILRFGLAPLLLFFIVHYTVPDRIVEKSAPGRLLDAQRSRIKPDSVVISCKDAVGAACWFLKRNDVYLLGSPGELLYGLTYRNAAGRLLDEKSADRLIDQNRGQTVLICRAKRMGDLSEGFPSPDYSEDDGPAGYVFRKY
jgi:4-amino-4-deoxy-L-arabinose transferase